MPPPKSWTHERSVWCKWERKSTPVVDIGRARDRVAERAAARGLNVLVEFHPLGGVPNISTAARPMEKTGRQNLAIMLDTLHLSRSGGGLAEVVTSAALVGGVQ
jgi:sugar phosphate isomerase/epimerase